MTLKSSFLFKLCILLATFDVSLQYGEISHSIITSILYMNIDGKKDYCDELMTTLDPIMGANESLKKKMFLESSFWADTKDSFLDQFRQMHFVQQFISKKTPMKDYFDLEEQSKIKPTNTYENAQSVIESYSDIKPPKDLNPIDARIGINMMINVLLDLPIQLDLESQISKSQALKFLMHFIQDLHQPNHVVTLVDPMENFKIYKTVKDTPQIKKKNIKTGDVSGNRFPFYIENDETKKQFLLHNYWDSYFTNYLNTIDGDIDLKLDAEASKILNDYNDLTKSSLLMDDSTPTIGTRLEVSNALINCNISQVEVIKAEFNKEIEKWISESLRIAKLYTYNGVEINSMVSKEYNDRLKAVVEEQFFVAAKRTELVLDVLYNLNKINLNKNVLPNESRPEERKMVDLTTQVSTQKSQAPASKLPVPGLKRVRENLLQI